MIPSTGVARWLLALITGLVTAMACSSFEATGTGNTDKDASANEASAPDGGGDAGTATRVVLRSVSSAGPKYVEGGNVTVQLPAGTRAGDLLWATVVANSNSVAAASDWEEVRTTATGCPTTGWLTAHYR